MSKRATAIVFAGLLAGLAAAPGCVVTPRTVHTIGHVATAALWTAAVVGSLTILTYHDPHYHDGQCGHYRRWHDGRWVYYYGDHWEYYDEPSAAWYFYAD